jgi:hypothetical protein
MSHVIGIPLLKGNSHVIVSCQMRDGLLGVGSSLSGTAVAFKGTNSVEHEVTTMSDPTAVGFFGFITEVNQCSTKCTVVRATESVCLPSDGTAFGTGDQVLVDPATGLISTAGTVEVAGTILHDGQGSLTAKNGQTGDDVANPVIINLSVSPIFPVVVAAATAKKSKLTPAT